MNDFYRSFIDAAKSIADKNGLRWDVPHDAIGEVVRDHCWNLTLLRGMVPPPIIWMKNLGYDSSALASLNERRVLHGSAELPQQAMSDSWKDFFLATLVHELLVKKNKPMHASVTVGRSIKILAAAAANKSPWEIDGDIVQSAYNAALKIGSSGKIAANLFMTIRTVVDSGHLADNAPLSIFCTPFLDEHFQSAHKTVVALKRQNSIEATLENVQRKILERKSSEKLPERKAFWELVRIIFTERPRSISDAVRFSVAKLAIISGLRIGENVLLPVSCRRWRDFFDADGNSAADSGGISRALKLRHFAEKQAEDEGPDGVVLYENSQYVPKMFEEIVLESLSTIENLTSPLRANLKRITETGRLFPEFDIDERRPVWENVQSNDWVSCAFGNSNPKRVNPCVQREFRSWDTG
nr:hypothetical protein DBT41_09415 [Aerococcus urinae]